MIWTYLLFTYKRPRTTAIITPPRAARLRRSYEVLPDETPARHFPAWFVTSSLKTSNIILSMDSIPPYPIDSFKFAFFNAFSVSQLHLSHQTSKSSHEHRCVTVANAVFPLFGMKEGSGAAVLQNTTCDKTAISHKSLGVGRNNLADKGCSRGSLCLQSPRAWVR